MKRIGIAAVAAVALVSVSSAAVPQTASALCRRVIPNERSNWANRTGLIGFWTCTSRQGAGGTGGFSKIAEESNEGRRINRGGHIYYCYHVESATESSTWANNRCTGNAATAGYFLSTERPWYEFRESAAKGKPVDKVAGSGGEQLFKTAAGTIACKALSLTEGEEPSEAESAGLGLSVQFEECSAFGLPATVKPVELELSAEGGLSLGTDLQVSATNCTVTFAASENTALETVKYSNVSGEVEIEPSVTGLTSEGVGSACSYSRESKGTYSGKSLVGWAGGGTLEWLDTEKEHLENEKKEGEEEEKVAPHYLLGSGLLNGGEAANVTTKNLGDFTLKPSLAGEPEPLCTGLSAPTSLYGGAPGVSETEIKFTGCTVAKHEKCDALSVGGTPGDITVPADDELVYTGSKAQAEKEEGPLGDLFTPASEGSTFVTLTFLALESGACPSTAVEVAVKGSVIGTVEPVNAMSKQGMLTFPKAAVKEAWLWLSKGKVDAVKAGLTFAGGTATQIGLADLELESGEEWGTLTA